MKAHLRTQLVLVVSLLLALALATPALATRPQTASNSGTNSGVINCPGFDDKLHRRLLQPGNPVLRQRGEPDPHHRTCRVSLDGHELGDRTQSARA